MFGLGLFEFLIILGMVGAVAGGAVLFMVIGRGKQGGDQR
jgi:hypothetical protein